MDDQELIRKCIAGDRQACEEFLRVYHRLMYRYIHATLKGHGVYGHQANPDDLYHDLFVFLFEQNCRKLESFQGRNGCSFASWLRLVVVNFVLDRLRKLKTASVSLDEDGGEGADIKEILTDMALDAADSLSDKEGQKSLEECIGLLDTKDKYFLELHLYQEIDLEQLAGIFQVSRPALDMRKSRIFGKLRDCFKNKGYFS